MSGGDPLATCRNIPLDRVAAALGYRRDPACKFLADLTANPTTFDGESWAFDRPGLGPPWLRRLSRGGSLQDG